MNASREKRAELHEAYVNGLEPAVARLRAKLGGPDDPQLDGTIGSLDAVNEWFLTQIMERHEDVDVVLPAWWDPADVLGAPGSGPFTSMQLALIDEVQAYVGEVMTTARPEARWVIYKGSKRDFRNGLTMLQIGEGRPYPVRDLVYGEALDVFLYDREVPIDRLSVSVRDALQ